MPDDVLIPGARDVRATIDSPRTDADACVVACPPHPQYGGSRSDGRIRAVADSLGERGIACLRFDYGDWDEGRGERTDGENAVGWAGERFERVGLFGYSFGAGIALAVAGCGSVDSLCCVSVLAPRARSGGGDVVSAVHGIDAPLQVVYGEGDGTVDWAPVVEAARTKDADVLALDGDHFFSGLRGEIGEAVADFVEANCRADT